jgi:hypothetical protein
VDIKRKKRTNIFKQLTSAGLTPSTIVQAPDGSIRITFGAPANDDIPDDWDKVLGGKAQ